MRFLLFNIFLFFGIQAGLAQNKLSEKMAWYAKAKPTSNLFIHFDKNVYANNETAYFTGYLLRDNIIRAGDHKIMSIALVRNIDSAVLMEDKFIMQNGICYGSMMLPDSIPAGTYHFLAFTDRLVNKLPQAIFTQQITIKTSIDPPTKANLTLVQATADAKSHQVLLSITTNDNRSLTAPANVDYHYGQVKKSVQTDASGQLQIQLPKKDELEDPHLYVKFKYRNDSNFMSIPLPQAKTKAAVKFYPEGGNLVNGLYANIGWEVKDQQKMPVSLKAFLYKNNVVIDTIETGAYGIGKFKLKPEAGENYSLRLVHSGLADSIYQLPKPLSKGITLTINNSVVQDTIRLTIKSSNPQRLNFRLHNFNHVFFETAFNMENNSSTLKIPLNNVPKGLTALTITDSLDRPLAERMFFAHYSNIQKIRITTDKPIYKQREKVTLRLNLKVDNNALVSMASVQNNRLELKKINDIESYTYLSNELASLPVNLNGNAYKDVDYLEQMLLVKGWRRYTWQDINSIKPSDTLLHIDSLKVLGKVSKLKKNRIDSVVIGTIGGKNLTLIPTYFDRFFNFKIPDLITPPKNKLYAFVNGDERIVADTKIVIHDEFSLMQHTLAKTKEIDQAILPSNLVNNAALVLNNNERIIRLKEVTISSKNDGSFRSIGANDCGDYVCPNKILNCEGHVGDPKNTHPEKGKSYHKNKINVGVNTSIRDALVVYEGCNVPDPNAFSLIKSIHLPKEFYLSDYKDISDQAYFSTLYWNYGIPLNSKTGTELSFYTSDITGKFRVVVQGITDKDVIYAEHYFEVIKENP